MGFVEPERQEDRIGAGDEKQNEKEARMKRCCFGRNIFRAIVEWSWRLLAREARFAVFDVGAEDVVIPTLDGENQEEEVADYE